MYRKKIPQTLLKSKFILVFDTAILLFLIQFGYSGEPREDKYPLVRNDSENVRENLSIPLTFVAPTSRPLELLAGIIGHCFVEKKIVFFPDKTLDF